MAPSMNKTTEEPDSATDSIDTVEKFFELTNGDVDEVQHRQQQLQQKVRGLVWDANVRKCAIERL